MGNIRINSMFLTIFRYNELFVFDYFIVLEKLFRIKTIIFK